MDLTKVGALSNVRVRSTKRAKDKYALKHRPKVAAATERLEGAAQAASKTMMTPSRGNTEPGSTEPGNPVAG